jgi:hypothetical protein
MKNLKKIITLLIIVLILKDITHLKDYYLEYLILVELLDYLDLKEVYLKEKLLLIKISIKWII